MFGYVFMYMRDLALIVDFSILYIQYTFSLNDTNQFGELRSREIEDSLNQEVIRVKPLSTFPLLQNPMRTEIKFCSAYLLCAIKANNICKTNHI